MEEANRTHKDRPFGWVLSMQQMMRAASPQRPLPERVDRRPEAPAPLGDLHNLAGPH